MSLTRSLKGFCHQVNKEEMKTEVSFCNKLGIFIFFSAATSVDVKQSNHFPEKKTTTCDGGYVAGGPYFDLVHPYFRLQLKTTHEIYIEGRYAWRRICAPFPPPAYFFLLNKHSNMALYCDASISFQK